MRHLTAFAAAAWLLFAGPAMAATPYLLGFWFGTGQPNYKTNMWLEQFLPDGEFRGQYRSCVGGKPQDMTQTGRWSLDGDRERIDILTANGQYQPRSDPYQLVSVDEKTWKYRYLPLGYVFTARRVDDKFELPSCEAIS